MKFWADENFNGDILRALLRIYPDLDVIRIQDTDLIESTDEHLLEEASKVGAIILTHDVQTLVPFAYQRLFEEKLVTGVIAIPQTMALGFAIDELVTLIGISTEKDFINRIYRLPL